MDNKFDLLGNPVEIGDEVIYNPSGYSRSMHIGVVMDVAEHAILVKGEGNTKAGWYTHDFIVKKYIIEMNSNE